MRWIFECFEGRYLVTIRGLDPHRAAGSSRHPLESQAPEAARWFVADLDG
jgi:hypothetical protein